MPRWGCSVLQRVGTYFDQQSINDRTKPEFGPLIWKPKAYAGFKSKEDRVPWKAWVDVNDGTHRQVVNKKNFTWTERMVNKETGLTKMKKDGTPKEYEENNGWEDFYRPILYYPVLHIEGERYNAFRWLFFQMYDDTGLISPDAVENERHRPEDAATARKQMAWEGDTGWWHMDMPGKIRPYSLVKHQRYLMACILWHNPHTKEPRKKDELYFHYKMIDRVTGDPGIGYYPDLSRVKWFDWQDTVQRRGREEKLIQAAIKEGRTPTTRLKKRSFNGYRQIDMVYPQVTGRNRWLMMRHYLNGGTDQDNPYIWEGENEEF